jgi:hypothetical protein
MNGREHLFLIVSDRRGGESTVEDLGTNLSRAMTQYRAREHALADSEHLEVVLVGSSSLETLRRTHSSYFGASGALGPRLGFARR